MAVSAGEAAQGVVQPAAKLQIGSASRSQRRAITNGKLQTPHDRMQPTFFGTYKTLAVPFGSSVIAQLPRKHRLVKNGSFDDRFFEGTYLYSDSATPCIWMFSIALQLKIKVQDFKISRSLLMWTGIPTRHYLYAITCANPAVTATNKSDNVTLLPSILPPRATSGDDSAAACPSVQHDGIDLHANLVHYSELEIAKALARHSVEIGLPKHYAPNKVVPEGKMRVVGIKAKKISSTKAVLIAKFISPPSLKNVQMQMFCTSLEPNTKKGQGVDMSIIIGQLSN